MLLRLGAAIVFTCSLCMNASAQSPAPNDSPIPVRKEIRVRKEILVHKAARPDTALKLLGTSLTAVFDTADIDTRLSILTMVPTMSDVKQRRELLIKGLQHMGNRSGSFLASVAAMVALQLGEEGKAILRDALERGLIRDERTLRTVQAIVQER